MFTGIVTALGAVTRVEKREGLTALEIASPYEAAEVAIGASIAHDGCCLTVVAREAAPGGGMRHVVEAAAETLAKTTIGRLAVGDRVNLERAAKLGDELGGHLVTGHVDGLGETLNVRPDGEGFRLSFRAPKALAPLIAPKGSIAVDGVSLTVNEVEADTFGVLLIPHTWHATNLQRLKAGDSVNLEADLIARYVARMLGARGDLA